MSNVLITGGAGFIGSHLTEYLLQQGHKVRILDDFSTGQRDNLSHVLGHENLSLMEGSITSSDVLREAVEGMEVVFHLAAAVGVKLVADDPMRTIETNIGPTEVLLKLARERGMKFFLASTSEVYGKNIKECWNEEDDLQFGSTTRPRWAYGCSKAIDEFLALAYHKRYNMQVVIGRFFNVVGPRQVGHYGMVIPRFVDQALQGGPIIVYDDGQQVRCFGHVREVVTCVAKLMETPGAFGKVFNIGSDQSVTIKQLAEEVIRRVDPAIKIQQIPYGEAYGADFEDIRRRVPDLTRLRETLGFKPSESLGGILDEIIAWKRQQASRK